MLASAISQKSRRDLVSLRMESFDDTVGSILGYSSLARVEFLMEARHMTVCPMCVHIVLDIARKGGSDDPAELASPESSFCSSHGSTYYQAVCSATTRQLTDMLAASQSLQRNSHLNLKTLVENYFDEQTERHRSGSPEDGAVGLCRRFLGCENLRTPIFSSRNLRSHFGPPPPAEEAQSDEESELLLDASKLLEMWDSSTKGATGNGKSKEENELASKVENLVAETKDSMVCDKYRKVQNLHKFLREKAGSTADEKWCYACLKFTEEVLRSVRKANGGGKNVKRIGFSQLGGEITNAICSEKMWSRKEDSLAKAISECRGGGSPRETTNSRDSLLESSSRRLGNAQHAPPNDNTLNSLTASMAQKTACTIEPGDLMVPATSTSDVLLSSADTDRIRGTLQCAVKKLKGRPRLSFDSAKCREALGSVQTDLSEYFASTAGENGFPQDVGQRNVGDLGPVLSEWKKFGDPGPLSVDFCLQATIGCHDTASSSGTELAYRMHRFLTSRPNVDPAF